MSEEKRKRGRPAGRKDHGKPTAFRLPEPELDAFKAACRQSGTSPAAVFRRFVKDVLNGKYAIQLSLF